MLRLTTQLCSRGQGSSGPGTQSPTFGVQISVEERVAPASPRPPSTIIEVELILTELAKALFLEYKNLNCKKFESVLLFEGRCHMPRKVSLVVAVTVSICLLTFVCSSTNHAQNCPILIDLTPNISINLGYVQLSISRCLAMCCVDNPPQNLRPKERTQDVSEVVAVC